MALPQELSQEALIQTNKTINALPIAIGSGALAIGAMIYLTDRPATSVYFIRVLFRNLSFYRGAPSHFGTLGYNLPAFIHVFAFSLLSAGVMRSAYRHKALICLFWFLVDTLFELGQKFPDLAIRWIPDWFNRIPFLENTSNYFRYGTFDLWDIVTYGAGALAAYVCLMVLEKRS